MLGALHMQTGLGTWHPLFCDLYACVTCKKDLDHTEGTGKVNFLFFIFLFFGVPGGITHANRTGHLAPPLFYQ